MPAPKSEADYRAEFDFDTLVNAEAIFNDKPRLKKALEYGKEKANAQKSVVTKGLRKLKK